MSKSGVLAIVPAAGQSLRLGQPKQFVQYRGTTLLAGCVDRARAVCDDVVVVTGACRDRVLASLGTTARTVHNPDWRSGLGASIACGVRHAAAGNYDAVLVTLPDQPLVEEHDLKRLLAEYRSHPDAVICSAYADTRGVPAVLPQRLFDELAGLACDRGAAQLIATDNAVRIVAVPAAALDIDTPADLARLPA